MKIISLNTWGARIREPFLEFIKTHTDTDIFCFQELYNNAGSKWMADNEKGVSMEIFTELQTLLPEHTGYFRPVIDTSYGIGVFVKNDIKVKEEGEVIIHPVTDYSGVGGYHHRNLEWVECEKNGYRFVVFNVHGLWNGMGKNDTPERIAQSQRIKNFVDKFTIPKILCGDFNLNPETESIQILEQGMKNLIKENNIVSTRTSLYPREGKFADYVFVSPNIEIKNFKVLPDEVSDHAALMLEI